MFPDSMTIIPCPEMDAQHPLTRRTYFVAIRRTAPEDDARLKIHVRSASSSMHAIDRHRVLR
jgi:hypothetical protein